MSADDPKTESSAKDGHSQFASQLTHGRERFLAHAIEHGFELDRRTPEDFLRHFPPRAIMEGLRDQPRLRANILIVATGVRAKVATKKSAASAGDDLQIALDEHETDAETIVTLFEPDDRVRFLDHERLWAYVTEGEFWKAGVGDAAALDRAARHVAYLLDRALVDDLISERDIVEGITVRTLAELLPRPELERVIAAALANARRGAAFTELDLVTQVSSSTLVKHIPLPLIWDRVIAPRIALVHSFVKPPPVVVPAPPPTSAPPPTAVAATAAPPPTAVAATTAPPEPAASTTEAAPVAAPVPAAPPAASEKRPPVSAEPRPVPKPVAVAASTGAPFQVARPNADGARKTRRSKPPSMAPMAPITSLAQAATSPEMAHIMGGADEVDVEIDDDES